MNVEKLKEISGGESHLLTLDSSLRNANQWPSPSEYSVQFDRPLQNVVGYDILDATLPNNTYSVDEHNNRVGLGVWLDGSAPETTTPDYIEMFAGCRSFEAAMGDPRPAATDIKIVGDNDVFTNAVASFTSDAYLGYFATAAVVPFHGPVPGAPVPVSEGVRVRFAAGAYEWSPAARASWTAVPIATVAGAPRALVRLSNGRVHHADPAALLTVPLAEKVDETATSVTGYTLVRVTPAHYAAQSAFYHEWQLHNFDIETGDHDIDSLVTMMSFHMPLVTFQGQALARPALAITGTSAVAPQDFARRRKMCFRCMAFFWLDMNRSTARTVLGFNERASDARPSSYRRIALGTHAFGSVPDAVGAANFSITTPGIVDLDGTRFVKLRCAELEGHRNQVVQDGFNPGIGVFKLYNTLLSHLRFDYNNYTPALTHPIAKLSKLTMRFENLDGSLYDFKGSDHHIMISIRTLRPGS